jgi:hypothetical protein
MPRQDFAATLSSRSRRPAIACVVVLRVGIEAEKKPLDRFVSGDLRQIAIDHRSHASNVDVHPSRKGTMAEHRLLFTP